jgi:polysaccharide biosynthesis/export protein
VTGEPRVIRNAGEAAGVRFRYIVLCCCLALLLYPAAPGFAAEAFNGDSDQSDVGLIEDSEAPGVNSYPLGPGDLLEVRVMGDESLSRAFSGQFFVEADGTMNYPVVGSLRVAGSSIGDVAQLIRDTVGGIAPISGLPFVRVAEYAPVYVVGDIARAGPYSFRPAITVMQLVLRAGGLAKAADMSSRITALRQEIAELEVVGFSLMVQRNRLLAELASRPFDGQLWSSRPIVNEDILENETALFDARRRERLSQVKSYEAQQRTYAQEIASLQRTITLHDQELELLKERYAGQESLADKGLAPKSQLLDARRDILSMERQGLEFRTALVRATQGRLAMAQRLDDVNIGTEVRNRQTLSEIDLNLARTRTRLAGATMALADLEQPDGPRSVLGPGATYTILRMNGKQFETIRVDELSFLQRGDILRVDLGSDEPTPQVPAAITAGPPATLN